MTIDRMIELLKIEHECILRNTHGDCDRQCEDCDLAQDDGELHEMYENVIGLVEAQESIQPIKANGVGYCCKCGWYLGIRYSGINGSVNYCANCGRKVKWE